jgi:protoporphyrinogen oxidase
VSSDRIVIIGAGPTGLGAAWRLQELGHRPWTLYEASSGAGGLASSFVDPQGFTWDLGGHVLFSHYRYFDRLMEVALGDQWLTHEREAWVWMRDRWLPYPLQNNIWRLPKDELCACLDGLLDARARAASSPKPRSFREWLLAGFGAGLCDAFMFPYNHKVWAYPPETMDVGWMGERVAAVDLSRVLKNVVHQRDDVGWGPNSTFRFPMHGGTGRIWQAVAERLPAGQLQFDHTVQSIDPVAKVVAFTNGASVPYDRLISTMPLDRLLAGLQGRPDLAARASEFVHSSSHIVGVGLNGRPPAHLATKCWMYFPEDRVPFYRATVFSNYSPNNVPDSTRHWSLMAEVSESPVKPVDAARVVDEVVEGFIACGFIERGAVTSLWHRRLEHGYPTPWLGRDDVLHPVDSALRALDIYSRGRFGAWKYEVANQDHSLMQGVEVVDHLLSGAAERTYYGDMSDR